MKPLKSILFCRLILLQLVGFICISALSVSSFGECVDQYTPPAPLLAPTAPIEIELTQVVAQLNEFWGATNVPPSTDAFGASGRQLPLVKVAISEDPIPTEFGIQIEEPGYVILNQTIYFTTSAWNRLASVIGIPNTQLTRALLFGHEYGHHLQTNAPGFAILRTILPQTFRRLRVPLEWHADALAGFWLRQSPEFTGSAAQMAEVTQFMESIGDESVRSSLGILAYIGRRMRGRYAHGSGADRVAAFQIGLTSNSLAELHSRLIAHVAQNARISDELLDQFSIGLNSLERLLEATQNRTP